MNFTGKLTSKIVLKSDYTRSDGTCAVYLQVFLHGRRRRFACNIAVRKADFDAVKQRVTKGCAMYRDYNLLIEKMLADINKIEVSYRLSNQALTIEKLEEEFKNPSSRLCFVSFWEKEMERQEEMLKPGTYRQQVTMLNKLKNFTPTLYFYDITPEFLEKIRLHMKKKLNNQDNTIHSFLKSFKKYLNIAWSKGIRTPLEPESIEVRQFKSDRTFLAPEELQGLYEYWNRENIDRSYKIILGKFLFSCFTGLRYSDVEKMTEDNIIGDILVFSAEKTKKLQRISLNRSAREFAPWAMKANFTNEYINRELKVICKLLGIKKKVSFHVGRHTFATNFLISGGRVEHLQKLLAHSNISETMVYVHIVESITDKQIHNMDTILTN